MIRGRTVNYSKNARCKSKCDARRGDHDKPRRVVKLVTASEQYPEISAAKRCPLRDVYLLNSNNDELLDFRISSRSKEAIISEVFIIAACLPATSYLLYPVII